jgi:GAF domain-containing protein
MTTREELLADTFLTLADTLIDDFDIVDVLTLLAGRCVDLLDAAAAGILLADPRGVLQVMASSSEAANLVELFQVQNEQGPCLDAFRTGEPITCADLRETSPWPDFAIKALAGGFTSVHAFPMVLRHRVLGTVNLFMTELQSLPDADIIVAQALAHAATLAVLQNQTAVDSVRVSVQLQNALNSRVAIEQAKGVLSEEATIGTDEAFDRLRLYASGRKSKLTDVAIALVNRKLPPPERAELTRPADANESAGPVDIVSAESTHAQSKQSARSD